MTPRAPAAVRLSRRFAENLVELRGQVGLSQEETARRADLHRTQISMLERADRLPRLDTIVKVAGAVEADPCELLTGMAWRPPREAVEPGAPTQPGSFEIVSAGRLDWP